MSVNMTFWTVEKFLKIVLIKFIHEFQLSKFPLNLDFLKRLFKKENKEAIYTVKTGYVRHLKFEQIGQP